MAQSEKALKSVQTWQKGSRAMKLGLKEKVILVTGASKGIGKAIAAAFAAEGSRVVLNARNQQELEQVVQ